MNEGLTLSLFLKIDNSTKTDNTMLIIEYSSTYFWTGSAPLEELRSHTPIIVVFLFNKIFYKVVLQFSISLVNDIFFINFCLIASRVLLVRDRPFNLMGGGYGVLFRSEFFFRTTRELEYLFLLLRKARIFFPALHIRLYDKNSESDYFCSSTKIRIFFSATL